MSTLTKEVVSPNPMVLAEIAAGANLASNPVDFGTRFAMSLYWDFGPSATTSSAVATLLQVLTSDKLIDGVVDDEDDAWEVIQEYLSPTVQATAFAGVVGAAGASTFDVTDATGLVLFQDHTIEGSSVGESQVEWVYPIGVSSNTITVRGKLKNTYAAGTLRSGALKQRFEIDLSTAGKVKFFVGNNRGGTERDVFSRVRVNTLNSVDA